MTMNNSEIFSRTSLLVGEDVMERLGSVRVIIFGAGGVGSWCAEGLIRSGISHLAIVDFDTVNVSNINRQLMATTRTVGVPKVDALKERLLEINPDAEIEAVRKVFIAPQPSEESAGACGQGNPGNAAEFKLESYDYIIDAIDSLKDKAALILAATATDAVFFSSMGSALKVDPTRIRVDEFLKVRDCPLGAALRKKLRQNKTLPSRSFLCVYDGEVLTNRGDVESARKEVAAQKVSPDGSLPKKAQVNGTLAHITSIFGMTLAGLVIRDIYGKTVDGNNKSRHGEVVEQ